MSPPRATTAFIPHGGGPLPLLGDPQHAGLSAWLRGLLPRLRSRPRAVIVVSAHWEAPVPTLTSGAAPGLIYDYGGFPPAAYALTYPSPGHPELARRAHDLLVAAGLPASLDPQRGFDHGHFVPLSLIAPQADLPTLQLSLLAGLDPAAHYDLGVALRGLRDDDVLLLGSGMSFHNMQAFFNAGGGAEENAAFEAALREVISLPDEAERRRRLVGWSDLPGARFCHPRSEHLMPLLVCAGFAGAPAASVERINVLGRATTACLW